MGLGGALWEGPVELLLVEILGDMEVDLRLVLFAIHVVVQQGQNVVPNLGQVGVLWWDPLVVLLVVQRDLNLFLHEGLVGVPLGALDVVLLVAVLVGLVGVLWGDLVEML